MFAPDAMATMPRWGSGDELSLTYLFSPARDSAPAGSRMDRVSSKTSFIAAQISSVLTWMISSTTSEHTRKVFLSYGLDRGAIREETHISQRDAATLFEGRDHGVGVMRLHADDLHVRRYAFDVDSHAGDQSAPANAAEYCVQLRHVRLAEQPPSRWCPGPL